MAISTSNFQDLLYDLSGPLLDEFASRSLLVEMLEREAAERKVADDAYLARLTKFERRRVLIQRRIKRLGRRYRNWWEENMAWRFRRDPPGYGDEW